MYNTANSDRTKLIKKRELHKRQIENLKTERVAKGKLIQEKNKTLEALNEFDTERRVQGCVMTLEHSYDDLLVRVFSLIKLFKELQQEKEGLKAKNKRLRDNIKELRQQESQKKTGQSKPPPAARKTSTRGRGRGK